MHSRALSDVACCLRHVQRAAVTCLALAAAAPCHAFVPLTPARSHVTARPACSAAVVGDGALQMGLAQSALAQAARGLAFAAPAALTGSVARRTALAVAVAAVAVTVIKKLLDTPSRPYDRETNTVGAEYDAWCEVRAEQWELL